MTEPLLSVRDLSVAFGHGARRNAAVRGLSYDLYRGETLAIVGESGSGKSVSSLALLGLLPPRGASIESGTATFEGRDLLQLSEADQRAIRGDRITMIFQEPMTSLTPVLRIGLQLTEALVEHKGMTQREARARAMEMLDLVGLDDPPRRMRQFPHELSGGMRQRVIIAMAMAADPDILIADEPTTALDVTVPAQILDLMRRLQEEFGTAIILITHDMGVVAEMADRVVVMKSGEKVEEGAVEDPFARPTQGYTRRLLDAVPRLGSWSAQPVPRQVVEEPAAIGDVLLTAEGLDKTFRERSWLFGPGKAGTVAMQDVGSDLRAGETLALVGESGSGKSTTGRAVLRLLEVDDGRIVIDGHDIRGLGGTVLRRARRQMQMVFQDLFAALNPRMSAGRLVAEPMVIHGVASGRELDDRVEALFRRVGLGSEHIRRYPHEFSGGQRQRLCIARALSVNPKLIVADEPTSALDVSVQAQVLELMLELQQSLGLAYLFISHDMAVVEEMAHRVAVMRRGRIVEIGPRTDVLGDARHPYTRALIAAVPVAIRPASAASCPSSTSPGCRWGRSPRRRRAISWRRQRDRRHRRLRSARRTRRVSRPARRRADRPRRHRRLRQSRRPRRQPRPPRRDPARRSTRALGRRRAAARDRRGAPCRTDVLRPRPAGAALGLLRGRPCRGARHRAPPSEHPGAGWRGADSRRACAPGGGRGTEAAAADALAADPDGDAGLIAMDLSGRIGIAETPAVAARDDRGSALAEHAGRGLRISVLHNSIFPHPALAALTVSVAFDTVAPEDAADAEGPSAASRLPRVRAASRSTRRVRRSCSRRRRRGGAMPGRAHRSAAATR